MTITRYIDDHAVDPPPWIDLAPPDENLEICVVIPAYDELDNITAVVGSLHVDELSENAVEILVCVNEPADAPAAVAEANRRTVELLEDFDTPFPLHLFDCTGPDRAYPPDDAGVGRARRLLMDTALKRLHEVGRGDTGLMACLDGDSPPDPGYLDAVHAELRSAPSEALAAVCRHRHPIPDDPEHARAIVAYELWMRFFEAALHLTGTPYAFQSIGSCMIVSARGYALADGVPPREALSDFYLLQKVVKTGGRGSVVQLEAPLVRPSARPSRRVPRGTGPSVRATMHQEDDRFIRVEPPRAFAELGEFFSAVRHGFSAPAALREAASPFLVEVLDRWNGWKTIDKLREHAPDAARFERQFHTWFDSLKVVKFANRSKERFGGVFAFEALRGILERAGEAEMAREVPRVGEDDADLEDWLGALRLMRREELRWW